MVEDKGRLTSEDATQIAKDELRENQYVDCVMHSCKFREQKDYSDGTYLPAAWIIKFEVRKAQCENRFILPVSVDVADRNCFIIQPM